jgi:hypothetical protein
LLKLRSVPFLELLVPYTVGILISYIFPLTPLVLICLLLASAVSFLTAFACRQNRRKAFILTAMLYLGALNTCFHYRFTPHNSVKHLADPAVPLYITGIASDVPVTYKANAFNRMTLKVHSVSTGKENIPCSGKLYVYFYKTDASLASGDIVEIKGSLRMICIPEKGFNTDHPETAVRFSCVSCKEVPE